MGAGAVTEASFYTSERKTRPLASGEAGGQKVRQVPLDGLETFRV